MKFKRTTCFVLSAAALLTSTALTGCQKQKAKDDENESVNLKWVMIGPGKQKDANIVWDEFNKKLAEKIPNTQIDFEVIDGSAFAEKWQLMSAASEQIDLAWSGYAISSIVDEIEKGAYQPLNDLIDEFAPKLKEELPEWLLELASFNGEVYGIPNYQMMATSPYSLHTRREDADNYMDIDAIKAKFDEWDTNKSAGKEFYGLIENYLKNMKDNGKLQNGVGVGSFNGVEDTQTYDSTTVPGFQIDTKTMTVFYDETSEYKKLWYDTAADWYKKGYIRNDVLSENMDGVDEAEKGYILWGHAYYNKTSEKIESQSKGFPTRVFGLGEKYYIKNTIPATMTAIGRTSVNPGRAMKVIELINTKDGKELYNLLSFGIEGKHYKKTGENRIEPFDYTSQGTSDSTYGLWKWVIGNISYAYELPGDEDGMAEYIQSIDNNAEILPCVGFKPDISSLSVELAQIQSVKQEYKSLNYGAVPNYETVYNEYVDKLNNAGVEKVREELQKQLDKWLSENKK